MKLSSPATLLSFLLAHLSKAQHKLLWLLAFCPSSICPLSTPLNIFSSVTTGPIFFKLHAPPSVKGGLKIYTNGHCLISQDGCHAQYLKTLKNLLLQNQESFKVESWSITLWTQYLKPLFAIKDMSKFGDGSVYFRSTRVKRLNKMWFLCCNSLQRLAQVSCYKIFVLIIQFDASTKMKSKEYYNYKGWSLERPALSDDINLVI